MQLPVKRSIARIWLKAKKADPNLDRTAFCAKLGITTSCLDWHLKTCSGKHNITKSHRRSRQRYQIVQKWEAYKRKHPSATLTSWVRVNGVTERLLRRWIADPELVTRAGHWKGKRRVGIRHYRKPKYPLAETKLRQAYEFRRLNEKRCNQQWHKTTMRKLVKLLYPDYYGTHTEIISAAQVHAVVVTSH